MRRRWTALIGGLALGCGADRAPEADPPAAPELPAAEEPAEAEPAEVEPDAADEAPEVAAAVAPATSPAERPGLGALVAASQAKVQAKDAAPVGARVLPPMPGWRLDSVEVAHDADTLSIEIEIMVTEGHQGKYQPLARAICSRDGRALSEHVTFSAPGGGAFAYADAPATGDRLLLHAEVYGMPAGPCTIELRALPYVKGTMYAIGGPHCWDGGTLTEGACASVVPTRPEGGVAATVHDLSIDESGWYEYVATVGRRLTGDTRLGLRARCSDGDYVRSAVSWGGMGWHNVEPGESRAQSGRLFEPERRDDCELSVEVARYDLATSVQADAERVWVGCLRGGSVAEGPCPAEMWSALASSPSEEPLELIAGKVTRTAAWDREYRVAVELDVVAHTPLTTEYALDGTIDCDRKIAWGSPDWTLGDRRAELHDLGAEELFDFDGSVYVHGRPSRCEVSLTLTRTSGTNVQTWEVGRWCAKVPGTLGAC